MSQTPETPSPRRERRNPRFDYRARSHESAHAGPEAPMEKIPEHPLICRAAPVVISTAEALDELIAHIRSVGRFAYDSEFIGEASFFPKLCLIQAATHERIALVDTLAGLDLAAFWELLADPSVEKVVHAGEQDLEPVFRALGRPAANVFDTQIAAGFANLAYPAGLSKLVRELVGVQLGKGFTFTHWDQRPLSPVQLRYAADDVRYLPALRDVIGQRLAATGRTSWAQEECAALCDPSRYRSDPATDFLRIRGANSLPPRNMAVLRELAIWRDGAARIYDLPPRSYLKDEILLEMARHPLSATAELRKVRGLPRPVEEAEGPNIIAAMQRGLAVRHEQCPVAAQTEETPGQRFSSDALWAVAQAWCLGHGVDPSLATSRHEIGRFVRNGHTPDELAEDRLVRGWRGQLLGDLLRQFLNGNAAMRLTWNGGSLHAKTEQSGGDRP